MKVTSLSPSEYPSYYHTYIGKVAADVDLVTQLDKGKLDFSNFILSIEKEKLQYAYAENKWSLGMVLQHIIDTERVFQYRALRFARNDKTAIVGFDQDVFANEYRVADKTKEAFNDEFVAVRNGTITLFKDLNEEELQRNGTASDAIVSVRALGFIILGHLKHHKSVIQERYLT